LAMLWWKPKDTRNVGGTLSDVTFRALRLIGKIGF